MSLDTLKNDLKELREAQEVFRREDISKIKIEVALLKQKVSAWAAVFGAVAGAIVSAVAAKLLH